MKLLRAGPRENDKFEGQKNMNFLRGLVFSLSLSYRHQKWEIPNSLTKREDKELDSTSHRKHPPKPYHFIARESIFGFLVIYLGFLTLDALKVILFTNKGTSWGKVIL